MRSEAELSEFTDYAVARWETLVRTAVLLGFPPRTAPRLAVKAVYLARASYAAGDGGFEPDVELFAELVDALRRDRQRWWQLPPTVADDAARASLAQIEPVLDGLTPPVRTRLVLAAVGLLPPEQIDQVVVDEGVEPDADLVSRVAFAATAIPVGPIDLDLVPPPGARERRKQRVVSGVAVAITLGLALLAGVAVAARLGAGDPVTSDGLPLPQSRAANVASPILDPVPVAWYAGGVLRVGPLDVPLAGVVALDTITGGVVATLEDGSLLEVDGAGEVSPIAQVTPGAEVATSSSGNLVAYIGDKPRELTVYDATSDAVLARVPVDVKAEVVAVDGLATYVNDSDGHFVVQFGDAARRTNGVTVLDAAGGVLVVASERREIQFLRNGSQLLTTAGDRATLSPSGRFALISRDRAVSALYLLEVDSGRTVPLPLLDGDAITDAAFSGDDTLVLVARGPFAPPSRDRDDPATTPRRSDLITCDPFTVACGRSLRLGGASTGPLLAH